VSGNQKGKKKSERARERENLGSATCGVNPREPKAIKELAHSRRQFESRPSREKRKEEGLTRTLHRHVISGRTRTATLCHLYLANDREPPAGRNAKAKREEKDERRIEAPVGKSSICLLISWERS